MTKGRHRCRPAPSNGRPSDERFLARPGLLFAAASLPRNALFDSLIIRTADPRPVPTIARRHPLPATAGTVTKPEPDAEKRDVAVIMEVMKTSEMTSGEECRVTESMRECCMPESRCCHKRAPAGKAVKSAKMCSGEMAATKSAPKVTAAKSSSKMAAPETAPHVTAAKTTAHVTATKTAPARGGNFRYSDRQTRYERECDENCSHPFSQRHVDLQLNPVFSREQTKSV